MGLFVGNPTTTDRIYIYAMLVSFAFLVPGSLAILQKAEISTVGRFVGQILFIAWLATMTFALFVTLRDKRTLMQNKRFLNGLYFRGMKIPQGVTSNAVWLLFPVVVGLWALVGYCSILYGPVYIIECIATDLKCR